MDILSRIFLMKLLLEVVSWCLKQFLAFLHDVKCKNGHIHVGFIYSKEKH